MYTEFSHCLALLSGHLALLIIDWEDRVVKRHHMSQQLMNFTDNGNFYCLKKKRISLWRSIQHLFLYSKQHSYNWSHMLLDIHNSVGLSHRLILSIFDNLQLKMTCYQYTEYTRSISASVITWLLMPISGWEGTEENYLLSPFWRLNTAFSSHEQPT